MTEEIRYADEKLIADIQAYDRYSNKYESFLNQNYDFRYNEITSSVEHKKKSWNEYIPITDFHSNTILREMANANIQCDPFKLRCILNSEFSKRYNPFKEYLVKLPLWDTTMRDYINDLSDTVDVKNPELWKKCFKKWFVSLIGGISISEIINHTILILISEQGLGKTTWFNKLVPDKLIKYLFSGSFNPMDKDSMIQLSECILINLDEIGIIKGSRLNALKSLVTTQTIRIRRPYATIHENYIRRASFCGSANEKHFLTDTTGNRRFLCFEAKSIDYKHTIDIDMVYAQGFYLLQNDFKFYFDKSDIEEINSNSENFRIMSPEEEALLSNYKPISEQNAKLFLPATQLHKILSMQGDLIRSEASIQKLGRALSKYGFERKKIQSRYMWALEPIIHQ